MCKSYEILSQRFKGFWCDCLSTGFVSLSQQHWDSLEFDPHAWGNFQITSQRFMNHSLWRSVLVFSLLSKSDVKTHMTHKYCTGGALTNSCKMGMNDRKRQNKSRRESETVEVAQRERCKVTAHTGKVLWVTASVTLLGENILIQSIVCGCVVTSDGWHPCVDGVTSCRGCGYIPSLPSGQCDSVTLHRNSQSNRGTNKTQMAYLSLF